MNQLNKEKINKIKKETIEISFLDLIDKVKVVTTIPAYVPKILSQQMVIYVDSISSPTVQRLYIYIDRVGVWSYTTLT